MASRRSRATLWLWLVLVAACASSNGRHGTAGTEIGVRRGGSWSTYSSALPRITGPTAQLELQGGHLRGLLASRSIDVRLTETGATGFGPGGPVNVEIRSDGDQTRVDGLWNGGPVHFRFAPGAVQGSVVVARGRSPARELACSYALDRPLPEGRLTGSSTCVGMPQDTQLEIDSAVRGLLKPNELALFLVAVLAAPPGHWNEWR